MVHGTFTYNNLPLTQAKISHSTADGVAPRFVGASFSSISVSSPQNHPPTTDSIRWEASISKTIICSIFIPIPHDTDGEMARNAFGTRHRKHENTEKKKEKVK